MPLPEGYLPREGDVLVLHGTVKYDADLDPENVEKETVWVTLLGDYTSRRVPLAKVVGIKRRTWKVGEKVRSRNDHEIFGEIVATHDDLVWFALASDSKSGKVRQHQRNLLVHCNEIEPLLPESMRKMVDPEVLDILEGRTIPSPPRTWESDQGPRPVASLDDLVPRTPKIVDAPIEGPNDPGYAVRDSSEDPDRALNEEVGRLAREEPL